MAGRGQRCGPARVTPLGGSHRTAAYGGRGVRPRYMLTTPAAAMSRLRCGRSSDSDGRDLLYAGLVQHARQHYSTALMEQGERCRPGRLDWVERPRRLRITADRADSEPEPRCTVGGWVTVWGQQTILTELFRANSVLSFTRIRMELSATNFQWLMRRLHLVHPCILAASQVQSQLRPTCTASPKRGSTAQKTCRRDR